MDYLKGYNIKPYEIQEPTNFVLFTDGKTNDIVPNQASCEVMQAILLGMVVVLIVIICF